MPPEYTTKDSGTHLEYSSGMKRDSQDGKPRFDLIRTKLQPYEEQMIYRYAMLLARGAEKYCKPRPIGMSELVGLCSCDQQTAILTGLTTLADSAETAMSEIFERVTQSLRNASERTLDSGPGEIRTGSEPPTWPTTLRPAIDELNKLASSGGRNSDSLLKQASNYCAKRMASAPSVSTSSEREALTWITTMETDWREGFYVHAATRAWASSETRSKVFGEHSPTCSTRQLESTSSGFQVTSARNWEEGDSEEELERAKASLLRHTEQLVAGEDDEDHAAAVWFNAQAIEYFRWRIKQKTEHIDGIRHEIFFPALELKLEEISQDALALITGFATAQRWVTGIPGGDAKDPDWTAPAPNLQSTDHPDAPSEAKARHQAAINDWHNRPKSDDIRVVPGPPATPTDRIKAEANYNLSKLLAQPGLQLNFLPTQRVDGWLKTYGIELIEGNLGRDPYEKIHEVEFLMRLKSGAKKLEKSGVANALDIQ